MQMYVLLGQFSVYCYAAVHAHDSSVSIYVWAHTHSYPPTLVMLSSTSVQRHRTAAGEVEGGRQGKGMKGKGWGEEKELVLERVQENKERREGREKRRGGGAQFQVWPKPFC